MYSGLLFSIWYSPRFIGKRFGARYRICIGANVHIAKVQCADKGAMSGQGKFGNDCVNSDVGGNIPSVTV